jgi:hypothetical protein
MKPEGMTQMDLGWNVLGQQAQQDPKVFMHSRNMRMVWRQVLFPYRERTLHELSRRWKISAHVMDQAEQITAISDLLGMAQMTGLADREGLLKIPPGGFSIAPQPQVMAQGFTQIGSSRIPAITRCIDDEVQMTLDANEGG